MQVSIIVHVSNNARKDEVACALGHAAIYAESFIAENGPSGVRNGMEEIYPKLIPQCFKSAFIKVDFSI